MIDRIKDILDKLYSILPKVLGLLALLLFYFLFLQQLNQSATKEEIARFLKIQVRNDANKIDSLKTVEKIYNCLTEDQFVNLFDNTNTGSHLSSNYGNIDLVKTNTYLLKKFESKHPGLLAEILLDNDSISKNNFLSSCVSSFKLEVDALFKEEQSKFNKENTSSIELPVLNFSLPKSFIPNILVTLILLQLLNLLSKLYNLKNIIKLEGYFNHELKETILIYEKYYLPSLPKLFWLYYIVLILFLITFFNFVINGSFFFKPENPSKEVFYLSHYFYGWFNIVSVLFITILLFMKLKNVNDEIDKFR